MISLDEVKNHIRVVGNDDDAAITAMIATATAHIENYTGVACGDDAPAPVKSAALLMVGDLYENREAQSERPLSENKTFTLLLNPYRMMEV
ncbi:head-tail connector protein [Noviherbaspirillum autotrophicum]|uniref:DNA packaging protein n=1 Tax=Noviherbaspirillum autotrophicum TaxID=709839 RepID=A0A0C2BS69_9BURK|nr:head-tail connector protein [Noviherbaspirillum autotrophicum]KIF80901.1 DNA packaging protein [Noviherbaspirillum autotrophicum]